VNARQRGPADFTASARRLIGLMRPQRRLMCAVLVLGVTGIAANLAGPRILGHVIDLIFSGAAGRRSGIDFRAVGGMLLMLLALYAAGGLLWIAQGRLITTAIQLTVFRMRADVQAKLARLPVSYFDRQAGDVLSRATHDIDNVAQTLQQTMLQITNTLLVVAGSAALMFLISPLLALISLVLLPTSVVVARAAGRRAQPQFSRQWENMGAVST
jgi:ATP-binding cassette subfamily B multidrug efflux pump